MPQPRPLPRSLVPLPGESLAGFLLRLSRRLSQPPARIAELTGLALGGRSGARPPAILLAEIPEPASGTFTRMTRLTSEQAARLGMTEWPDRYPPVITSPESTARGACRLNGQTVLAPATRYCPECLAGDGSGIQRAFGGPWLKAWHLPVVFACTAHQRLLEHQCPGCGQAVRGRRAGGQAAILPAMLAAGLHPAQCRSETAQGKGRHPACRGARLDQASPRRAASPGLITLQDKILGLPDPDGPASTLSAGMPAPPDRYFADLRALGLLACSTWPAARDLSPSEEAASAIDQHVDSLRRQAAERQATSPGTPSRTTFGAPPADAAASSGLLHIAGCILGQGPGEIRELLRSLLPPSTRQASKTSWGLSVLRSATPCSDGLQAAYGPLLRAFAKAGSSPQGRRAATLSPQRWQPGNIPAFIPEDSYARHFTPITGVSTRFARRTAALRLVQMTAGGSLGEAARFLGITTADLTTSSMSGICTGVGHVHTRARLQPGPRGLESALTALARELDDPATPLVNYQHRRQTPQDWRIDEGTWAGLVGQLPRVPGPQPEAGARKRQTASIYVWTLVTSGEHHFAPRAIEATQPPEVQEAWAPRRNTIWSLMRKDRPGPHYASLIAELSGLATSLAKNIDTHG
jgi:TniQ